MGSFQSFFFSMGGRAGGRRGAGAGRASAGYALAVLSTGLAIAVRWFILPLVGDTSALIPFIPAVMVSGWYGGIRPALLATLLGGMAGNYLWQEPRFTFAVADQREAYSLLFYLCVSLFIASLTEGLHRARRDAEGTAAALRESEQRFRLLVDQVQEYAIYMLDADGRIVSWNAGAERISGYTAEDALGQHLSTLYRTEDNRKDLPQRLLQNALTRESVTCEGWNLRKDETAYWASTVLTALHDPLGRQQGFACVIRDITAAKRAQDELLASREQLRLLTARMEAVREQERTRIACELHDELGQALTALKIEISALESPALGGAAARAAKVREIGDLIDSTIQTVRRVVTELRPRVLDVLGLTAAIEWQVKEFRAHTGIRCQLRLPDDEPAIGAECSTALFRILQEALTNVARHAGATTVSVLLETQEEGASLVISDNGRGITPREAASHTSLGLFGMQERARSAGGAAEIARGPGGGTTVRVWVPVRERRARPVPAGTGASC